MRDNLQIEMNGVEIVPPRQVLCIRQTASTLEILRRKGSGTRVICLTGWGLGLLRRLVLSGEVHELHVGRYGQAHVGTIRERMTWAEVTEPIHADPNPQRPDTIQIETLTVRDLWFAEHLEVVAVPRRGERLLLQFAENHAYVCTPKTGFFQDMLSEVKRTNLSPGQNRFSSIPSKLHPRSAERYGIVFETVEYKQRNLASDSAWTVIMDYRSSRGLERQIEL